MNNKKSHQKSKIFHLHQNAFIVIIMSLKGIYRHSHEMMLFVEILIYANFSNVLLLPVKLQQIWLMLNNLNINWLKSIIIHLFLLTCTLNKKNWRITWWNSLIHLWLSGNKASVKILLFSKMINECLLKSYDERILVCFNFLFYFFFCCTCCLRSVHRDYSRR